METINKNVNLIIGCIGNVAMQYASAELSRMAVYERFKGIHAMAMAMCTLEEIEEAMCTLEDIEEYGIYRDFLEFDYPYSYTTTNKL